MTEWQLISEHDQHDMFACKRCNHLVRVHVQGEPLPDECHNCATGNHVAGLYKSSEVLRKERDEALVLLKQARGDSKALKKLHKDSLLFAGHVYQFIVWMDEEMKKPSDNERGKRVAKALNALEMSADRFTHFSLKQSFDEIKKMKHKKVKP